MLLSKNTLKKSICAVGGRSGGHLIPCIHYVAQKKLNDPSIDTTLLLYAPTPLTTSLVNRGTSITHPIPLTIGQVPYRQWYLFPWWALTICYAFFKSIYILLRFRPIEVMSSGGLESIPVCLAARLLRIPVVILELNVIPGKAILFLAKFIRDIHICFAQAAHYFPDNKIILSPYPIRFSPQQLNTPHQIALAHYQLTVDKKTIVILGGSQGSTSLNRIAAESIIHLASHHPHIQVIHQVGNDDSPTYAHLYKSYNIDHVIISFEQHAEYLYSSADTIIARAGAGTLFEIAAFLKSACIVPLETTTTDHQKDNAQSFARLYPERFIMLLQKDLEHNKIPLVHALQTLLRIEDR